MSVSRFGLYLNLHVKSGQPEQMCSFLCAKESAHQATVGRIDVGLCAGDARATSMFRFSAEFCAFSISSADMCVRCKKFVDASHVPVELTCRRDRSGLAWCWHTGLWQVITLTLVALCSAEVAKISDTVWGGVTQAAWCRTQSCAWRKILLICQ